ncbi:hypothetical protein [Ramlibacter albus]|uniref:Uncharacterized protein n=1 Tax=Ramlibacter albus TaxID=2079448 RepID=A0A923S2U4_9BURK|nr:hypothetical protein [Ramlibacter albus]MBC5765829.1 hypothetical protein [Ramlibacter albus]
MAAAALPALYIGVFHPLTGDHDLLSMLATTFIMAYFSAVAAVLIGVPSYFALRRLNLVKWWSATVFGALAGAVVRGVATIPADPEPAVLLRFALLGAAAGFLFWLIWRQGHGALHD